MKRYLLAFLLLTFVVPSSVNAFCSSEGYTVIYINGVRTDENVANEEKRQLALSFLQKSEVRFINGHNPSRIASIDDFFTSVSQAYQRVDRYSEDFDLKKIIYEIQTKVTTRKILIVGYSQGSFYANALYKYLIENGVPQESIAVYNVATPASYVSGDGNYITSANDTAINFIRKLTQVGGANTPLSANVTIPKLLDSDALFPGHSLTKAYLENKGSTIASGIGQGLSSLVANDSIDGFCFNAQEKDAIYTFSDVAFRVTDPVITPVFTAIGGAFEVTYKGAKLVLDAAHDGVTAIGNSFRSLFPPANTASAIQAFDFVRTAYGSSLTREDLEELNDNSPSVQAYIAARDAQNTPVEPKEEVRPESPVVEPEPRGEVLGEFIAAPPPPAPVFAPATSNGPLVGAGGGGGGGSSPAPDPTPAAAPDPVPVSEFSILSPVDNSSLATTSVEISGTAPALGELEITFGSTTTAATADSAGAWTSSLILAEGTTTISVSVYEDALSATSSASRTVYVELPPPPCVVPDALDLGETWNETFTKDGGPYVLGGDTYVRNGNITIEAGTVFKFKPAATLTVHADVNVHVNGTQSEPVLFTSLSDDSAGGDTNCDDGATSPNAGDWGYAWFGGGAWNSSFNASYLKVRYGGSAPYTTANDGTLFPELILSYQKFSGSPGVAYSLSSLETSNSSGIGTYAYIGQENSLAISNSSFHDNVSYGLYRARVYDAGFNAVAGALNAKNNWWGDASGPLQADANPAGLGDELDSFASFIGAILFDPWLSADPFSP